VVQGFDPTEILDRPLMANLATVTADGAPCNAPVWFLWEDGVLWMLGSESGSSVLRLLAEPRCAVEVVDFDAGAGILLHCGLRGRASIEANDPALFRRLLGKYLGPQDGWNPWFIQNIARIESPTGRMIRLKPDSVFTNNVSYFRSGPDLAWPG